EAAAPPEGEDREGEEPEAETETEEEPQQPAAEEKREAEDKPQAEEKDETAKAAPPRGDGDGAQGRVLSRVMRRLISEHDLDPAQITGTGAGGRITRADVLAVI